MGLRQPNDADSAQWPGTGRITLASVVMPYPLHRSSQIPASPDLPAIEEQVLAYWDQDGTFQASLEKNPSGENGSNEFVFYDGPPFANGLPHYGHLLTGYAKDVVPRFQTMLGRRVDRRFGWDTHGLPAELEAMRQLGIKTKEEILDVGVDKFNDVCRQAVLKYTKEWENYVTRQARWVSFANDYKTMDLPYMESVMWGFKQLWDKGLVYEGFRVLPYCWNDQTPLSNHELRMDDEVYKDRQDPAVSVGFRLTSGTADGRVKAGDLAVIWTTTPWTLPANLLIAVGADIEYVVVASSKPTGMPERYILAEALLPKYVKDLLDDTAIADSEPQSDGSGEIAGQARNDGKGTRNYGQGTRNDETGIEAQIVARILGKDLVGLTYQPPFSYYATGSADGDKAPNAFRIVTADYVTTTDGSGLVHTAPAFGEDDKVTSDREGVEAVMPVGPDGCFIYPVTQYEGEMVLDANKNILEHLKNRTFLDSGLAAAKGIPADEVATGAVTEGTVLLKREQYTHSYPHCYRCKQPLIYMGVSSWFVSVTKIKDRMLELGDQINWTPEYIKDGIFGKWIANARDWSITRNRFWGSPVPVWKSDNPEYPRVDAYGSLAELEKDFGVKVTDLHRPYIDQLTRPNPDDPTGQSTMRRVEDIMDVWVDSGSMPYAQVHYPFENQDWFEHHYPGDFIVEYIGQTRGWFYVLHVLATGIFDRPAFRSAISHGIVLGSDGQKMSKSLRNYPDVSEVFERDGADAMRWYLMSSSILRGGNLIVTEDGIRDSVRQVLLPLWSVYYFYTLYANSCAWLGGGAGYQGELLGSLVDQNSAVKRNSVVDQNSVVEQDSQRPSVETPKAPLDQYILAKTFDLVSTTREQLATYDIPGACESVRVFLDILTNWYVRTQRDRFWAEDKAAFDTLYTVLETLCRVMAPLAPLLTEEVWRGLTGGRSVHLMDWPTPPASWQNDGLVAAMDQVRNVVSTALSLRKATQMRVRQPLSELIVAVENPTDLEPYLDLLRTELNVKKVTLANAEESKQRYGIEERLVVNARATGPRLGKQVQAVIKAAKAGQWHHDAEGGVIIETPAGDVPLEPTEYTLETVVAPDASGHGEQLVASILANGGFTVLDLTMTTELAAEGYARDAIREIQDARKHAGLDVSDRIDLTLFVPDDKLAAVDAFRDAIIRETLAKSLSIVPETEGKPLAIQLAKAAKDEPFGPRFDNADGKGDR